MAKDLTSAIAAIQAHAAACSGMREAPSRLPAKVMTFPTCVTGPGSGDIQSGGAGMYKALHTVTSMVLGPYAEMGLWIETITPIIEAFFKRLWNDPTLGDTCDTITAVSYTWRYDIDWNGKQCAGPVFSITIKIEGDTA